MAPWFGLQTTFFTYQQEQKVNSLSKADKLNTNSRDFALIMTPERFCSLDLASPEDKQVSLSLIDFNGKKREEDVFTV